MRNSLKTIVAALAFASASASGAHATTELRFTITGDDPTVTFELPENPTPESVLSGIYFVIGSTPAVVAGTPADLDFIQFYNAAEGGYNIQYEVNGSGLLLYEGPQMYTGPETSPTFGLGSFKMISVNVLGHVNTLTISEVPESSTWAMMLLGFAGLGLASYRSSRGKSAKAS
jgi:hypothetical protein